MTEGMKEYKIFDGKRYELFAVFSNKEKAQGFAKRSRYTSPIIGKDVFARVEKILHGGQFTYLVYLRKGSRG
jgi:hypothetical protein